MGQASSHEKKKRGKKGSHSVKSPEDDGMPRRKPSFNKTAKRNPLKAHKKAKKTDNKPVLEKQHEEQQRSVILELPAKPSTMEDGPWESPRYGIFDDLQPTVCIEDDGVSLSSASSDDESPPRRMAQSRTVHRSSSRRLRRTCSSGRRRSRPAKLAKKSNKTKSPEKARRQTELVKAEDVGMDGPAQPFDKEKYRLKPPEDLCTVLSADDSGCSTLEDHLFPDDSLSEDVLGCLVNRGMEFDDDLSEIADASSRSTTTPSAKTRKDEGYESLQKTGQSGKCPVQGSHGGKTGGLTEIRELILSQVDASSDAGIADTHWSARNCSISDEERLSVSADSEHTESVDTAHDKSCISDSFSDSGYSSKTKLSECETDLNVTESRLSTKQGSETIDWLEATPTCVDNTFTEHFQKVLRFPKSSIFYEGNEEEDLNQKGTEKCRTGSSAIGVVDRSALENHEDLGTIGNEDSTFEKGDLSVQTASSSYTTSVANSCVDLDRGTNPSEVYV